ncbi:hypothetical protein [Candidatus Vidania fulgoroideorum]
MIYSFYKNIIKNKIGNSYLKNNSYIIYGSRDFLKIKFSIYLSKYLMKKNKFIENFNIITNNSNFKFSYAFLKKYFKKIILSKFNICLSDIKEIKYDFLNKDYSVFKKIYIFYCIEDSSEFVQNYLLKLIESDCNFGFFLFISFNKKKIIKTLKSRCLKVIVDDIYYCSIKNNKKYFENFKNIFLLLKKKKDKNSMFKFLNFFNNIENLLFYYINKNNFIIKIIKKALEGYFFKKHFSKKIIKFITRYVINE